MRLADLSVNSAKDGEATECTDYDLILMDIQMPRQKKSCNYPSHSTTRRHIGRKFGPVSERSAESKTAMRKPLIGIEISPGDFDASRKVRKGVRTRRRKFWARKKPLKILGLVSAINFVACLKSPLLYQLS